MTSTSNAWARGAGNDAKRNVGPTPCIGLIGLGAIGRDVAARLKVDEAPIEIVALIRRAVADANVDRFVKQSRDLIAERPDLVVEAAGHGAVAEHVVPVLEAGIPVVLVSVGALADDPLRRRVMEAAQVGRAKLMFPGGAVGALDYIRAVSQVPDLRIRYCSRKPVAAWQQELIARGLSPDTLNCEVTLFEGTAREAALAYPQNLNVAMSLALAGPGIEGVDVRVVADPKATGNTHEIEIESAAGRATLSFNNTPSPRNPKTSALTALSIVCAVREHISVLDAADEAAV